MATTPGPRPSARPVTVPMRLGWSRAARCHPTRSKQRPRALPVGYGGTSPRQDSALSRRSEGPRAGASVARYPRVGADQATAARPVQTCCRRCCNSRLRATVTATLPRICKSRPVPSACISNVGASDRNKAISDNSARRAFLSDMALP